MRFIEQYRPHVMTDHHEMGGDRTFFFQPGVPTRWHPFIPDENRRLTEALGRFHARALDAADRLYYSGESFDDFYPGKGSTWPDLKGTVGILFEQAGTRGQVRDTAQGRITLPMSVHNQVLVSLSTIRGAVALEDDIKAYRRSFERGNLVPGGLPAGWIFDDGGDPGRAEALLAVIQGQGLDVFGITEPVRVEDRTFEPGRAWVVPVLGPRAALAQALFATSTTFQDSTFYDVSAWSLPHAFGVRARMLRRMPTALATEALVDRDYRVSGPRSAVAWVLPWDDFFAPAVLYRMQAAGARARVALEPFTATSDGREVEFERGAVIFHTVDLPDTGERPVDFVTRVADGEAPLIGLDGGLSVSGPEPGSPRVPPLKKPSVALLAGDGVNAYAAGSTWHLFDHRLGIPLALIRPQAVSAAMLERTTHLVMVDGDYEALSEKTVAAIGDWITRGGVLVVTRRAALWAQEQGWLTEAEARVDPAAERYAYTDMAAEDGRRQIGGAVLAVELDRSHPLAFGVAPQTVGLLRRGRIPLAAPEDNPFTTVGAYTQAPLLNGYLPEGYADAIAGAPALLAQPKGRGVVIAFAEDPAFRAVWWVGQRLLSNAVAFGEVVRAPRAEYQQPDTP